MHLDIQHTTYVLNHTICIFPTQAQHSCVNLMSQQGPSMSYSQDSSYIIDYPGEYDTHNLDITCFAESDGRLDYIIWDGREKIAIIQSSKALEFDGLNNIDQRLVTDQTLADQLTKMELDGEISILSDSSSAGSAI